jgi:hypothetical protein
MERNEQNDQDLAQANNALESKCKQHISGSGRGEGSYHFQRPNSPYPHLELALDTSDIVKFNAFPPAAASGFPPEKEQLLRHSDSVAVSKIVALDVSPQTCECDTADDGLVGLTGTVTPAIIVIETTVQCG